MNNNWLVAGLLSSPCLYLLVTLLNRPARSEADFEFGARKLHPSQVLDSSITYSLQVAAIALFATWGYQWGLWAMLVPLFWFAGYALLAWFMSDRFLRNFAEDSKFRTLHSFLANAGEYRLVCAISALVTVIALSGPAMYEAFTVGRTVAASLPVFGPSAGAGIALAFLGMSAVYILWGGFRGVVQLDRWQLAFGYGGFCIAFAVSLVTFADRVGRSTAFDISLLCLTVAAVMAVAKVVYELMTFRFLGALEEAGGLKRSLDTIGLIAIGASLLAFVAAAVWLAPSEPSTLGSHGISPVVSNSKFGFSALAIVSLFLANGLFQFVDITQWQRLLSIAVDRNSLNETARILRGNILIGGLCGSATWCIAVLFGIFLRYVFPEPSTDPYSLLSAFLRLVIESDSFIRNFLAFTFVASLVSIMSSTVDAMVSATSFTVRNDWISVGLRLHGTSTISRIATVAVLFIQLAVYLAISEVAQSHVDAVLYVCYSFQLALLPSVVSAILRRSGSQLARLVSMLAGSVAACTPLLLNEPERAYELSPLLSVIASWTAYLLLGGIWGRAAQKAP